MKINLLDTGKELTLEDKVFACDVNNALLHQTVVSELLSLRQGSKAQKTRGEVRGGGKKPWRQKGTGRARVGSANNPLWKGGGVTFAAKPRQFKQKINRKMHQGALRTALSSLVRDKKLEVISDIKVKGPKTKELVAFLKKNKMDHTKTKINIIVNEADDNLLYAARNIPLVKVTDLASLTVHTLVNADKSLVTKDACEAISARLK